MSEKWTKGPWGVGYVIIDGESVTAVFNSDGDEICNFGNTLLNEGAHANLISAAPEMYDIIIALLEYIDAIPSEAAARFQAMPGVCRDWIEYVGAKARGEA